MLFHCLLIWKTGSSAETLSSRYEQAGDAVPADLAYAMSRLSIRLFNVMVRIMLIRQALNVNIFRNGDSIVCHL